MSDAPTLPNQSNVSRVGPDFMVPTCGSGAAGGSPSNNPWGVDLSHEVHEEQPTDTDNRLVGYLMMAHLISSSNLCIGCQMTLSSRLISEDSALYTCLPRPATSTGGRGQHWSTRQALVGWLRPNVNRPPVEHLPSRASIGEPECRLRSEHLARFKHRWLTEPAWRYRKLRGWLARLSNPRTFQSTRMAGVPYNEWELKLWWVCVGYFDLVDLAQGRDFGEWADLLRMHIALSQMPELGARCGCSEFPRSWMNHYNPLGALAKWQHYELVSLEQSIDPFIVTVLKRRAWAARLQRWFNDTSANNDNYGSARTPDMDRAAASAAQGQGQREGTIADRRFLDWFQALTIGPASQDGQQLQTANLKLPGQPPARQSTAQNSVPDDHRRGGGQGGEGERLPSLEEIQQATGLNFTGWLRETLGDAGTHAELERLRARGDEIARRMEVAIKDELRAIVGDWRLRCLQ